LSLWTAVSDLVLGLVLAFQLEVTEGVDGLKRASRVFVQGMHLEGADTMFVNAKQLVEFYSSNKCDGLKCTLVLPSTQL
jgi:hypothetical protein